MKWFKRDRTLAQDDSPSDVLPWPPDRQFGFDFLRRISEVPPHCDAMVLHAPGDCAFCDHFLSGAAQALRRLWGIAFTGQTPQPGQVPCPSDARRGTAGAHVWPGNIPRPAYPHIGIDGAEA